jgi:hypothetical protein
MLKISESALVPKMTNLLTSKGKALFGTRPGATSARTAYTHMNKPVREFEASSLAKPKEHPLVGFKEDATRGIPTKKKGLIGVKPDQMHDWHSKRSAPVRTPDPKPDFHPTEPTGNTVDWQHKQEPTNSTYKKIKGAIKKINP